MGDHPAAGRSPPGHGGAEVGDDPDSADRADGRHPVSRGGSRAAGRQRPHLRGRRTRGADLRRHDATGGALASPSTPADADGTVAHSPALLILAGAGHRRRHRYGPQPGGLDEQRSRGHREVDHRAGSGSSTELSGCCTRGVSAAVRGAQRSAVSQRKRMFGRAVGVVRPVLIDRVERDHRQSDAQFLRRRIVVAITLAVGATLLGLSFAVQQGDPAFYPLTFGLAATWTVGSLLSGPLHLGHILLGGRLRRPITTPIAVGLLLAATFVLGALLVRTIPPLVRLTEDVLGYARLGNLWIIVMITLLNGVAEELFFRGALFAAIGVRHPVLISTVLYASTTIAGGNPLLVFTAAVLGTVVALQRRASGGILAPILTHITWSLTMLFVLPPVFGGAA